MTDETDRTLAQAIRTGIAKAQGIWKPEHGGTPTEQADDGYDALNAAFEELARHIREFSGGAAKIGHLADPKVGGYIPTAAATAQAGSFPLLLLHTQDEDFKFAVGTLETDSAGFPATLTFPEEREGAVFLRATDREELEACLARMVSGFDFGCALKNIIEHRPGSPRPILQ